MAGKSLLSEAELQAMFAEAEKAVSEIPNLDDGRNADPAKVYVPLPGSDPRTAAAKAKPAPAAAAEAPPPENAAVTGDADAAAPQRSVYLEKTRAAVGAVLAVLDRPFAWIPPAGKAIIGFCAIASLAASLVVLYLVPAALPRRDGVTFLQEKMAELRSPPPAPESKSAASHGH